MPTLVEIGPSNASQGQHRRKDATEQIKNLTLASGPTTGTCGIAVTASALEKPGTLVRLPASVRFFLGFCCVLSSMLPLRSVGRSNFDKGRHNLETLIQETDIY